MRISHKAILAAALGSLIALLAVSSAFASHVRPAAGAAFRVPIVIAYNACAVGSGNASHNAPLAVSSCTPPVQASQWLTSGSEATGGSTPYAAQGSGFVKITVCPSGTAGSAVCASGPSTMGTNTDVRLEASGTDIRCKVGGPTQSSCEGGQYSDYVGQVEGNATIRITDHFNTCGTNTSCTATAQDLPFPVDTNCVADPAGANALAKGGRCQVLTSANGVVPGSVPPGKRGNVEIGQIKIFDGGQGGVAASPDATTYGIQGIFIP
jgi:hypothetical protein